MPDLIIHDELISSHGALSVYHASIDELNRRYGGSDEDKLLRVEELLPPSGAFVVARLDGHPIGGVGLRPISDPVLRLGEIKATVGSPRSTSPRCGSASHGCRRRASREIGYLKLYLESGYAQPEALESIQRTAGTRSASIHPARTRTTSRRASANSSRRSARSATRSTTLRATRALRSAREELWLATILTHRHRDDRHGCGFACVDHLVLIPIVPSVEDELVETSDAVPRGDGPASRCPAERR